MKLYFILISILINSIDSYKIVDTFANRGHHNNKNIYLNYLNDDDVEDTLYRPHDYKYLTPSSPSSSSGSFYDDVQKSEDLEQLAKNFNLNDYEYVEGLLNGKGSLDSGELDHTNVNNNNINVNNNKEDDEEELEVHSSLIGGHQYVSGGAGEGKQHLQPDGAVDNKEEIKSDEDLPAYCDPPNPCPIGVVSDDCDPRPFQEFSAEYSKSYQEQQNCMCDDDHNECHKSNKVKSQDKIVHFLNNLNDKLTQVVAKKSPRVRRDVKSDHNETRRKRNPYLTGEAIKIHVAKKSSLL